MNIQGHTSLFNHLLSTSGAAVKKQYPVVYVGGFHSFFNLRGLDLTFVRQVLKLGNE